LKNTLDLKIEIEVHNTDSSQQKGTANNNKSLQHSQSKKSNLRMDLSKKDLLSSRRALNNTARYTTEASKDRKVMNSLSTTKIGFSTNSTNEDVGVKTKANIISARSTKSNSTNFPIQNNNAKDRPLVGSSSKEKINFKNTFTSYSTSSSLNKNKDGPVSTQKSVQLTNLARTLKSELKIVKVTSNLAKSKLEKSLKNKTK
jgi:hypothetical protein